jgi:hypothetical protein
VGPLIRRRLEIAVLDRDIDAIRHAVSLGVRSRLVAKTQARR